LLIGMIFRGSCAASQRLTIGSGGERDPNQTAGASRTYVLAINDRVVGYYSIAAAAIAISEAPSRIRRNMPDPIPMAVLGRLAIDRTMQGRGLGRLMLRDAVLRTAQAAQIIGMRGILLHALSPSAKQFYEQAGFRESPGNPMLLMVSMQDVLAALRPQ
jgi:GNAT superfamily N-acetyltransferase